MRIVIGAPLSDAPLCRERNGRCLHPSSFDVAMDQWQAPAYLKLTSVEKVEHDAVWLRHAKANA